MGLDVLPQLCWCVKGRRRFVEVRVGAVTASGALSALGKGRADDERGGTWLSARDSLATACCRFGAAPRAMPSSVAVF